MLDSVCTKMGGTLRIDVRTKEKKMHKAILTVVMVAALSVLAEDTPD